MEVYRRSSGLVLLLGLSLLATALQGVQGEVESEGPSESECRPYIEKALKHQLGTGDPTASSEAGDSKEDIPTVEITDDSNDGEDENNEDGQQSDDIVENVSEPKIEPEGENSSQENQPATEDEVESEQIETGQSIEQETNIEDNTETDDEHSSEEEAKESRTKRDTDDEQEKGDSDEIKETSEADPDNAQEIQEEGSIENEAELAQSSEKQTEDQTIDAQSAEEEPQSAEQEAQSTEQEAKDTEHEERSAEEEEQNVEQESVEEQVLTDEAVQNVEEARSAEEEEQNTAEETQEDVLEAESAEQVVSPDDPDKEEPIPETSQEANQESLEKEENVPEAVPVEIADDNNDSKEQDASVPNAEEIEESADSNGNENPTEVEPTEENEKSAEETTQDSTQESTGNNESEEKVAEDTRQSESNEVESVEDLAAPEDTSSAEEKEAVPVEDLSLDMEIPSEKRPRDHVEQLLKLDEGSSETEKLIKKVSESTLKELKKLYENAIKPLETLYKYRDLSNRHFGDAEIFSKPLILFMGPWSGGKSSIINYLTNNEYNETSLRTGAEPSPAYFNILMHGEEAEIIEGTELAADFTFSGLQKFGQGLEERLRGVKLPIKLLEKVNIVEIPGILEVRKQVSRVFPFNDACQWFIDRADIIFLVYDPSKLDVGPETEAILDQLKGREHQTRIVLNKADQVKPEELMRVQGALIWNISPLMSSPQPPVMYTTSLWSRPYEPWAPVRLLQSQERAFLRDLRGAIEKRIENKIASARRFAVRVRNHAKMVDCYLTTYYNHKSVFGNRKQVADEITEHPQDYHIYEGLSTLTNISRYDLPDPDVYKDFFKLNPLYEFQQLSATCTYFRGCPINRLDVAIAYDLPELVGTHKKLMEATLTSQSTGSPES